MAIIIDKGGGIPKGKKCIYCGKKAKRRRYGATMYDVIDICDDCEKIYNRF